MKPSAEEDGYVEYLPEKMARYYLEEGNPMRISDLIEHLENIKEERGDLLVLDYNQDDQAYFHVAEISIVHEGAISLVGDYWHDDGWYKERE